MRTRERNHSRSIINRIYQADAICDVLVMCTLSEYLSAGSLSLHVSPKLPAQTLTFGLPHASNPATGWYEKLKNHVAQLLLQHCCSSTLRHSNGCNHDNTSLRSLYCRVFSSHEHSRQLPRVRSRNKRSKLGNCGERNHAS